MCKVQKRDPLTKILAVVGSILVWLPILAPIVLAVIGSIATREFHFDFLMPAELFPVALAGGALLLWAALRARTYRAIIGWGLGIAVVMLVGSQALAVITGLASGETGTGGWQWVLVLAGLAAYSLAIIAMGIGGVLLMRKLFKAS
jgi:hypothetical protein